MRTSFLQFTAACSTRTHCSPHKVLIVWWGGKSKTCSLTLCPLEDNNRCRVGNYNYTSVPLLSDNDDDNVGLWVYNYSKLRMYSIRICLTDAISIHFTKRGSSLHVWIELDWILADWISMSILVSFFTLSGMPISVQKPRLFQRSCLMEVNSFYRGLLYACIWII